jgi:hypothetical protein
MADIVDETLDNVWFRKGISITRSATQPTSKSFLESFFEIELSKDVNLC